MKAIAYKCLWLITILLCKDSFSQRLIPRLGVTGSWISYSDFYDKGIIPGFSANVGYEINLKGRLHLQPDIAIVTKGSKYTVGSSNSDRNSMRLFYAEASVPTKYSFESTSKIFILFGPTFSIGVGGRLKIDGPPDNNFKVIFTGYPVDGYDLANQSFLDSRFDFGLQIGGGVELWKKIILDVRYTHGFIRLYSDFAQRGDYTNYPYEYAYNRSFQFSVGVPFKIGKSKN